MNADNCEFHETKITLGISHEICTNEEVRKKNLSESELAEYKVLNCDSHLCARIVEKKNEKGVFY